MINTVLPVAKGLKVNPRRSYPSHIVDIASNNPITYVLEVDFVGRFSTS